MIAQRTVYWIKCDECGEPCSDELDSFGEAKRVSEQAQRNGRDLCVDCDAPEEGEE